MANVDMHTIYWRGAVIESGRGRTRVMSDHNTLVPISRLPECLLTDIFILVRDIEHASSSSPPCLHVSHVCRAWRDAALQCSLLWTDILFRPPEWTAVMLHRARTAPLTVNVSIHSLDIGFLNSLRLALSHIRHIRFLSIRLCLMFYGSLDHLLYPLKSDSPDILEDIRIECTPRCPCYFDPPFKIAPKLRRSELARCHTDWNLFYSVGHLTSLVLNLKYTPVSSRLSIENFLFVLQSMNKLETLALTDALPELPMTVRTLPPPQDIVPVRLEHLSHLSLSGYVLDCANFMRYIVMPRCRHVRLEAEARWSLHEIALAVSPLSNLISSIFDESDEQKVHYYGDIQQTYHNQIDIKFQPFLGAGYTVYARLIWCPPHTGTIMDTSPGFGSLLLALPLDLITGFRATLSYVAGEHIHSTEWLGVMRRLSHVQRVELSGGYTYDFVNAFHEAHASLLPPSNGLDTAILPDLASLTIEHAHFSFPLGDNQLYSTLTRSLTWRQQLQLPVPIIVLQSCHITPRQLATLNLLTPKVVECTGEPETWGVGELDDESSGEDNSEDGDED